MPLDSADIQFYYTGQATGPSDNHLSLGGTKSPYTIPDNVSNNVFDDVTGDEAQNGDTEYRAIAIYINTVNSQGSFDALNPKVWISDYSSDAPDTIYIAKTTFPLNSNTMGTTTDEDTPPDENEGLEWIKEGEGTIDWGGGTLKSEHWVGIWLKRVVPPEASAYANRFCEITFQCETTASPFKHTITKKFVVYFKAGTSGAIPPEKIVQ
ncbi:MAG: hypothetical protein DRO40_06825 [Thermoprotei archaeon]|nr:MAG: hypothetical protein DRO40_06825 [Thermoprotei archaeon]